MITKLAAHLSILFFLYFWKLQNVKLSWRSISNHLKYLINRTAMELLLRDLWLLGLKKKKKETYDFCFTLSVSYMSYKTHIADKFN